MIDHEVRGYPSPASAPAIETVVRKDLADVRPGVAAVTMIEPEVGSLTYRGYPVQELARRFSFEEVAYLLWHGELPERHEIVAQNRAERAQRALDPVIAARLADLPATAHPLETLRTAVSLLGERDPSGIDNSPAAVQARALRLFAVLPSVVAMDQRRRRGLGALKPRDHLGYAANFLYMTFGKVPEPQIVAAFETSLILYAGQGLSPAAFTGPAGLYRAAAAAIGALGEKQDGASPAVAELLGEIAVPGNARPWVDDALAANRKVAGFGHRVYPSGDPRVPVMRNSLGMVAALRRGQPLIELYEALAAAMYDARGLRPGLDYPAGLAYHLMGFDSPTFAPIFVAARVAAWSAQWKAAKTGAAGTGGIGTGEISTLAGRPGR